MAERMQVRRDTDANWTSSNPILAQGEWGYESDTEKIKIGDGTSTWTVLQYGFVKAVDGVASGLTTSDDIATIKSDPENFASVEVVRDAFQTTTTMTIASIESGFNDDGGRLRYRVEASGDLTVRGSLSYTGGTLGNFVNIGTGFPAGDWDRQIVTVQEGVAYDKVLVRIISNTLQILDSTLVGKTSISGIYINCVFRRIYG